VKIKARSENKQTINIIIHSEKKSYGLQKETKTTTNKKQQEKEN